AAPWTDFIGWPRRECRKTRGDYPDGAMHVIPLGIGTLKRELQLVRMPGAVGVQPSGCSPLAPARESGSQRISLLKRRCLWISIFVLAGVWWPHVHADVLVSTNSPWRFRKGT